MISPSTHDASTAAVKEVVASGASASSVEVGTSSSDDVDGSSGSFSCDTLFFEKNKIL
jgi:hypothetical protein